MKSLIVGLMLVPTISLLWAQEVTAAAADELYSASPSRFLKLTSKLSDGIEFTLSIGVADGDGDTECVEGDVSCLTISGIARGKDELLMYVDPEDPDSRLVLSLGRSSVDILTAQGSLGTGTANQHHLGEIAGRYGLVSLEVEKNPDNAQPIFFQTPSRNISCVIWGGADASVRCDIGQMTPTYQKRPDDCDLDWGNAFGITGDGNMGELLCYGDTVVEPSAITLGYGERIEQSGLECLSEKKGLTCTNITGHGFFLSRTKQSLF